MKKSLLLGILLFFVNLAFAQDRRITGKVTSASDGEVLPGVTIQVVGTNTFSQTNDQGEYSINATSGSTKLKFSSIGYIAKEAAIGNSNVVNVTLSDDENTLDEIVIQVPYGTVRQTAFVGSQATVTNKTLSNQRQGSFTKTLEGLVPGLAATNGGGEPGKDATLQIRGIGSISAGSGPLFVLDGVPYAGSNSSINPDDIESITVLKDASATALYGARGSNGVIMLTTKRGKSGTPKVTLNTRLGFQQRGIKEYDRVNQQQYYEGMWEATRNRLTGGDPSKITDAVNLEASNQLINGLVYNSTNVANGQVVLPNGQFNPDAQLMWNDSWEKVLTQTPIRQDYNLNVSGGSNTGNYFLSLGYLNEEGMAKFSKYDRYTARLNTSMKPKTWLNIGLGIDGALGYGKTVVGEGTSTTNPFYYSRNMGPIYPVWQRDANGNILHDNQGAVLDWGIPSQYGTRPYAGNSNLLGSMALDQRLNNVGNINANTFIEAKFLKDFTFKTTLGGNYYNAHGTTYQNSQFGDAANVSGRSTKSNDKKLSFTFNQVLTYDKKVGGGNLNVLVGHENYRFVQDYLSATKTNFPFPGTTELDPASVISAASSYQHNHRIEGYFSRAQYDWADKYLLSASFRRDGNSRFFPGDANNGNAQWGNFWSIGGGWRMSQEAFMKQISWINELKLKASYGEQGNEALSSYYAWQSLYSLSYANGVNPGAIITSLPNEKLSWETSRNLNTGVDFGLFGNRLSGSIEWYRRNSSDMLFAVPLPMSTGISSIMMNIGDMYNTGVDAQIGYNVLANRALDWRVDVNFSQFKNRITKLPEENKVNGIISGSHRLMEGRDRYTFWLREYAGVDPTNGDALYYKDVLDANGKATGERTTTNNISQGDYYEHGSAIPDFRLGLNNSFRYKNVELSFLLNYSHGGKFYDGNYAALMHVGSYGSHWHKDILDRWQKPGDITDVPRVQNALANQSGASSRFLVDATYLNVKNITLSYNLPKALATKIGTSNLALTANLDNAMFFSKRKGMDPQFSFSGVSDWSYPVVRTYTFGLSIGL